jgi:hypothetical protein
MHLIQAGGRHPRLSPDDYHDATPGDPFPGSKRVTTLTDTGEVSTSFPGGAASGITLQHIVHDTVSKEVRFDIVFKAI